MKHQPPAPVERPAGPRLHPFFAEMRARVRVPFVVYALIALNVLVYVAMVATGVSPLMPDGESMLAWGGNFGPLTATTEPWRLLTCVFVHGGLLHLLFNMSALKQLGELVERMYGSLAFAVLYFAAGIGGSITSTYMRPEGLSVGASGAIFGVVGALVAYLVVKRKEIPPAVYAGLKSHAFTTIIFAAALGFAIPNIDNAAHAGGFVSGLVVGVLLTFANRDVRGGLRAMIAAVLSVALLAGGYFGLVRGRIVSAPQWIEAVEDEAAPEAVDAMWAESAEHERSAELAAARARTLEGAAFADAVEREVNPELTQAIRRLDSERSIPREMASLREAYRQYLVLLRTAYELDALAKRGGDPEAAARADAKYEEARAQRAVYETRRDAQ